MPSGLTYALEEKNFDVQKWLLEDIPRQYGICIMLRDDPMNLSDEEIRKRLIAGSEDLSYHENRIKEAEDNIEVFKKRTIAEWKKAYKADREKSKAYFEENLKKKLEQKAKYEGALNQIKEIQNRFISHSTHEVIKSIVARSADAIEKTIDWDFNGMKTKFKYESLEEYMKSELSGAIHNATHHRQQMIDSKKRDTERLAVFDAYVAFIKTVTNL